MEEEGDTPTIGFLHPNQATVGTHFTLGCRMKEARTPSCRPEANEIGEVQVLLC